MSIIEEIKAQRKMGLRTGLIQMNRNDVTSQKSIDPAVREQINGDDVQMLVYGENVMCDVLIIRHPPVLQEWQAYLPEIDAKKVNVIINQTPMRHYGLDGQKSYDINQCVDHLREFVGKTGTWYPVGPSVRDTLWQFHRDELSAIHLSGGDWVNIIDPKEWQRPARPEHDIIRIGRHSHDHAMKWPPDKDTLLAVYPDKKPFEVHILGGARTPEKLMGRLPSNWLVHPFGDMGVRDFLMEIDVFVYYTHPDWVEEFGRVIIEAMAVGVPVIIPPPYKALFGNAALYAEPRDVQEVIEHLMQNTELYDTYVQNARKYVENHFGYGRHVSRLRAISN